MSFKSKKQEALAFATKQPFAKKWADKTDQKNLPTKVGPPGGSTYQKMLKKETK